MEPNQSKQLSHNASKLVSRWKKARLGFNLLKILKLNPWLLLGGFWLLLIGIGAAAVFSITNTSLKKPEYFAGCIIWLLIGFTFVIGAVLLGKRLNRSLQFYRLRQATQQLARQERRRRLQEERKVAKGVSSRANFPRQRKAPTLPVPVAKETVEIVSPSEDKRSLIESESLAEIMDIRKHRSLDSILHDL